MDDNESVRKALSRLLAGFERQPLYCSATAANAAFGSHGISDRLARFQREAEVLAALNHPNIGAIYGLERTPDLTALVMELVEGEDLSAHVARGPIAVADALPIAKEIAEALEYATSTASSIAISNPPTSRFAPTGP